MLLRHFIGARDVTALPVNNFKRSNLVTRIVSAIVMMPVVIYGTYLGYPYFNLLVGLFAALIAWEYGCMISSGRLDFVGKVLIIGLVASVMLASTGDHIPAILSLVVMAVIFLCIDLASKLFFKAKKNPTEIERVIHPLSSFWIVAGGMYMGGACVSLIWIRNEWDNGLLVVMWILFLVWASDCGAYAMGRLIGGPKLAPKISPNKTWAGLVGCVISACIMGALVAQIAQLENFYELVVLSGLIGLVSQMGDLMESAIKRYCGVKDSGNLIPGHGGVLDRVDALLAAIIAVAFLSFIKEGPLLI